ncbi:Sigma-70, region 4 [Saccharopolyspora kobensis]|uniref:Sigma-70, region 4 n=1 Tax=Saccharopolyspora kobensis TaxID=146035 RepID=A0A1H6ELD6_9PSEU|nr:sigma factor-like helix-turn-helix DNA-binding protein [Saccharopolyspora kobensis]SEG98670.1 Sigma-70, region 4 [Saccharopolyspora kobensis]SFD23995.1 Sigma-70, region 4 [Saccharopolyspora kobensis]
MPKNSPHLEERVIRQRETLTRIAPNKVGRFSERVLRLAANDRFSEAVAAYNASATVAQSFDNKPDADAFAEILRGDVNARFVGVVCHESRWDVNAEIFSGPSTDELAHLAADGDELAFWALYARVLPRIERNAADYGVLSSTDGPGAVFDEDDAHQRQVETLLGLLADLDFSTSFVGKFNAEVREVFHEARRLSKAYTLPQNHDYALVQSAVRAHAGDVEAAAEDLASNPDRARHISREKFYALLAATDSARYAEFDPAGTEDQADPTQADVMSSVESGFDNAGLESVWLSLGCREREILTLRYGLDGTEPSTPEEIAEMLGLTKRRINQILKTLHDRIAAANVGLSLESVRELAGFRPRKPAAKTASELAPVFPVHVRHVTDETAVPTVAERRANPQDGVRAPLLIRVGEQWSRVYPQRVPERVELGVHRSSTELRS